jgi:hypothetical protein
MKRGHQLRRPLADTTILVPSILFGWPPLAAFISAISVWVGVPKPALLQVRSALIEAGKAPFMRRSRDGRGQYDAHANDHSDPI